MAKTEKPVVAVSLDADVFEKVERAREIMSINRSALVNRALLSYLAQSPQ